MTFASAEHWLESILGYAVSVGIAVWLLGVVWGHFTKVPRRDAYAALRGWMAKHDWGGFWP